MPSTPTTAKRLRRQAVEAGRSVTDVLREATRRACTFLAVCPNSEAVAWAAMEAAALARAPLFYAATLNQVDLDGGYTGWTPARFAALIAEAQAACNPDGLVVIGLDHGGPWKKDLHAQAAWPFAATWAAVLEAIEACIDAGYELLHLDPTVDLRLPPGEPLAPERLAEHTMALLAHAEAYRQARRRPPLAYEVGTEEVGGGLASPGRLEGFLDRLGEALAATSLPRPTFVVGDVGTRLDTDGFEPARARQLAALAARHGLLVKGHYTDGVAHPEWYPAAGMGGANVGPALAAVEYQALEALVAVARLLGYESRLPDALRAAVVESGRWHKWLHPAEQGLAFDRLTSARQAWLLETGSRYVWTHPAVREARAHLYDAVGPHRDPDAFVRARLRLALLRYFDAFNLVGLLDAVDVPG